VVKNDAHRRRLAQELAGWTRRPIDLVLPQRRGPSTAVVCPFVGGLCGSDKFQIMVYADVASATAPLTVQTAIHGRDAVLRYALVPDSRPTDNLTGLQLETVAGGVIFDPAERQASAPQPTVCTVNVPAYPAWAGSDPLQRKRVNIWHNPHRNRLIARLAQACAGRDQAVLRELLIDVDAGCCRQPGPPRVAILVESPEHGHALRKCLPWPLLTFSNEQAAPADARGVNMVKAIITTLRASRQGVAADVVIRADGTALPWHDSWGLHPAGNGESTLIVDITDDFDRQARQDAAYRQMSLEERRRTR
jgi:hypothetical protein